MIEVTILAYMAGMIDADGYISIQRSRHGRYLYFGPQVGIAGTRREPHDLASSLWGGRVYRYEPKNKLHRHPVVASAAAKCGDLETRRFWDAGWTVLEHTRQKNLHVQNGRGSKLKEAPEILIVNGPSYAKEAA